MHESKCRALFGFLFSQPIKALFFGSKCVLLGSRWLKGHARARLSQGNHLNQPVGTVCSVEPNRPRCPAQGGQRTPCQKGMCIHISSSQLCPAAAPQSPSLLPPAVAASSEPPLEPGSAPGTPALGRGHTPPPSDQDSVPSNPWKSF